MVEQVALHERASSAAYFTECRDLNRYKDNARVSKRLLQQKLDKVVEGKEVLLEKYYAYAEKANKDLDSEQFVSWITPKLDIANDVLDEVFVIIEELEAKSENEQLKGTPQAKPWRTKRKGIMQLLNYKQILTRQH